MRMPEATMHKDHSIVFWKNKIRLARQAFIMQPVAVASGKEAFSYYEVGFCILSPNAGHHFGSLGLRNYVNHTFSPPGVARKSWYPV